MSKLYKNGETNIPLGEYIEVDKDGKPIKNPRTCIVKSRLGIVSAKGNKWKRIKDYEMKK